MQKNSEKTEITLSVRKPKSIKSFLTIFIGQSFSLFGSQLVQFALVWWLTLTSLGSATVLAFAMMMALIPQIVLTPLLGPLIDRWNRRRIMILADAMIALSVFVLALLFAFNLAEIWHVYVLMLVRSIGGAFHWPAMQASTVMLVEKKQLSKVNGLTQSFQGLANVLAPPIAAVLVGFIPIQNILAIDIGTAMMAILPLLFIQIPQPQKNPSKENGTSTFTDFKFSFSYLWRWKGGLFIMIGAMIANLLIIPAVSFVPILVTEHFGGGAFEYALLTSSLGIGAILGGLALGAWSGKNRRIVIGMVCFVFMGLGIASIGVLPSWAFLPAVIVFFFSGSMMSIGNGSIFAILQNMVPPQLQGRIFSLVLSGSAAMTPLGLAIGGPLIDIINVQFWFLIGGCVMAFVGTLAFFSQAVMKIEERTINPKYETGALASI
ncbi:MAG: MFS transporter [Candidatus Bathyarchaeota archaeon]|nr:MFS transporter [Candidatus Bathyarchaeota archaeon]